MLELDEEPQAREAVRRSLEDVRRIARELRPETLDHLGLQSAMRSLCIATASHARLRVVPQIDLAGIEPSDEVELAVYRVAQESLTNIVRHAHASQALVTLQGVDGGLRLVVRDDGRGLDPHGHDGAGISGMRERAMLVGGRVTVTSAAGTGTEVRFDVPKPEGLG
jgi:two-component system sensor histidine kinase UhpB